MERVHDEHLKFDVTPVFVGSHRFNFHVTPIFVGTHLGGRGPASPKSRRITYNKLDWVAYSMST